ncbi:MAG TPA: alanine racemase [bacterium]|nr:alanine racemase [bacterium]HPT29570.1 alanine racemase [bacterium]
MMNWFRQLIKPEYEPLNRVEIIQQNILDNFSYLQSLQPGKDVWPVLKSNAYGHGLKEICRILNKTSAQMVVVDSFPEAQIAYRYFKGRVLILGEMPLAAYRYANFSRTEFCVYNIKTFKYLACYHAGAKVHLFINTGMNREGIGNLDLFLAEVAADLPRLQIVGLASHLSSADTDSDLNQKQTAAFFAALDKLKAKGINPSALHLGNSAAIFSWPDSRLTAYRAGLALYGYNPFLPSSAHYLPALKLKPALRVISQVVVIQALEAGSSVSYNESYIATQPTNIAIIPFGYFEGLDRGLSNQAEFRCLSLHPFYAKIAGRVCMNLTALDINNNPLSVGDRVEVISADPLAPNCVSNLAKLSDTIPYEVLVRIQANIHRQVV